MDLLIFRIVVLVIGSILAAAQDAKTGLISDKITYAMIALGIIFNLAEFNWIGLAMGAIVFGIGYLAYYLGKIGGGDVKLFTGFAFLLPFYQGKIFILSVLFIAALSAVTFYSIFYMIKYARKGIQWKENQQNLSKAIVFAAIIIAYFFIISQTGMLSTSLVFLIGIPFLCGLVFVAFEKGIRKNFFLKKIKLKELDEDEIVAEEFLDEKTKKLLKLSIKGILGEKEKEKLEKAGIKEILVYRNLPPFGPFILLGVIVILTMPDLIGLGFI